MKAESLHLLSDQAIFLYFNKKSSKNGRFSVLGSTFQGRKSGCEDFEISEDHFPHYSPSVCGPLPSFVPDVVVPVVPVFQPSRKEPKPYASLNTLCRKYTWVFEPVIYESKKHLIEILPNKVIKPAEDKRLELRDIK